jgi:hypothetical protein
MKTLEGNTLISKRIYNKYIEVTVTKHSFIEFVKALIEAEILTEKHPLKDFEAEFDTMFYDSVEFERRNYIQSLISHGFKDSRYFIHKKSRIIFIVSDKIIVTSYLLTQKKYNKQYREKESKL